MKDPRILLGVLFITGYYATLWVIGFHVMPVENIALIKDAMLQLGPPVGVIVGALFRTSQADETRAENSGKAFDAITAQANASASNTPQPVQIVNDTANPVPTTETKDEA